MTQNVKKTILGFTLPWTGRALGEQRCEEDVGKLRDLQTIPIPSPLEPPQGGGPAAWVPLGLPPQEPPLKEQPLKEPCISGSRRLRT